MEQKQQSFYKCNLQNGKCTICGQLNPTKFPDEIVHMQCRASTCKLLGKETPSIKVNCLSCNSTPVEVLQLTNVCQHPEILRCLPDYVPLNIHEWNEKPESKLYHLCRCCPYHT